MAVSEELKRARKTATVYGVLALTALISMVYSYFTNAAADKVKFMLKDETEKTEQLTIELQQVRKDLKQARDSIILLKSPVSTPKGK